MKKTLMLVLVMALAFSCFAAVLTAGASTEIVQGTKSEQGNYFKMDRQAIKSFDFEEGKQPERTGKFFATLNMESDNPISGSYSFKVSGSDTYAWNAWYFLTDYTNFTERYYMEFDVRMDGSELKGVVVSASAGYTENSTNLLMEAGLMTEYKDGKVVGYTAYTGNVGWPTEDHWDTSSLKVTNRGNDVWHLYFEFTLPETNNAAEGMQIQFKHWGNDTNGVVVYDNIEFGKVIDASYYTIDWDYDYNGLTDVAQAWDQQPIWAVSGELDKEMVDGTQCLKINVGAGSDNTGIGGFESRADFIEGKKLVKHAALTYFQYDIFVDNCTMVNIWSSVQYSAVMFNGEAWHGEGAVVGFKATALESGAYRISYFIDMTENRDMDFNINASSTDGGAVYIDNLVVAHEDYSAYLKSTAMYNLVGTADVSLDFDAKGKEVTSVKLDDVALTADDYTIADGKLTIKAGKIATTELGKNHTLSVVTTGSETPVTATISQIDNRPEVTASYSGKALEAVTYNGTTNYNGTITLTLTGVADGDVVTVSGTAALASKNAGATKVVITNLVLAGADAYKYKLANESVEIDITVNALQLTIGQATVADKTYDGTTTANVTAGALQNVADGDNVTVIASGVFDSKDVASATKVTVTYTITGDDAANYIAPVASEVAKTISKANATVTAKAATKQEGAADPELKYDVTGLVEGDALTGALARDKGETAGEYNITIGTLANSNYEITFTGAKLTITAKPAEDKPAEDKGCFGVVGAASVAVFAVAVAAVAVVCKRKED